jgi:hypothetical protein
MLSLAIRKGVWLFVIEFEKNGFPGNGSDPPTWYKF